MSRALAESKRVVRASIFWGKPIMLLVFVMNFIG